MPVVRQDVLAYAKKPCMNLHGGCLLAVVAAPIQAGRREAGVGGTIGRPLGMNATPLYSLFFRNQFFGADMWVQLHSVKIVCFFWLV